MSSYVSTEAQVLDYGDKLDLLKQQIKGLNKHGDGLKETIRKLMLEELKVKKLRGEKVEVSVREKKTFILDIMEKKYPEFYKEYTRIESKIVTYTQEEFIFDKEKFIKDHPEAYENCFKIGTPGVYITRLNT